MEITCDTIACVGTANGLDGSSSMAGWLDTCLARHAHTTSAPLVPEPGGTSHRHTLAQSCCVQSGTSHWHTSAQHVQDKAWFFIFFLF